jgi:Ricin-type beta-trefoil lectin domain
MPRCCSRPRWFRDAASLQANRWRKPRRLICHQEQKFLRNNNKNKHSTDRVFSRIVRVDSSALKRKKTMSSNHHAVRLAKTGARGGAFALLLLLVLFCQSVHAQMTISVRGSGIDIRDVGTSGLTHIYPTGQRTDWEQDPNRFQKPGTYHFFDRRPAELQGKSFATTPIAKGYMGDDSRQDYGLDAFKADAPGAVTIAVATADLQAPGWKKSSTSFSSTTRTFYLYSYQYNSVGQWVDIPKPDPALPTLLFAEEGRIKFDNPLRIADLAEGVMIAPARSYIIDPSILILPNGDYIATARGGPISSGVFVRQWVSKDRGRTWGQLNTENVLPKHPSPFHHDGSLYYVGDMDDGFGGIQRSTDNGRTWSDVVRLDFKLRTAPSHVINARGRLWIATEYPGGSSVFSAPVNADLMNPKSWVLAQRQDNNGAGNESDLTATRNGGYPTIMSKGSYSTRILNESETIVDKAIDQLSLPGNDSKYTTVYDAVSDKYWALTSESTVPANVRTGISLYSSTDLKTFKLEREVLKGKSTKFHGFNYPHVQIDGDDLVFVSRTAWESENGLAQRWHDGNMLTFHRIRNFRAGGSGGGGGSGGPGTALINPATGLCLDVVGNDDTPSTPVQVWTCNKQSNQRWQFTAAGEVRAFDGSRCLDVAGQGRTPGTPVHSFACNGQANQKWALQQNGTLVGVQSGLCLDIVGAATARGTPVQVYGCHGRANQQWRP